MSEEAPKLYTNKPKKAQLKQAAATAASSSPAAAAAASYKIGSQSTAPPPPPPQKESFAKRYKFFWPLLLTVNLAVGFYLFIRTSKKDSSIEEEKAVDGSSPQVSPATALTSLVAEKPLSSSQTVLEQLKPRDPIPENQQREIFKWILEEKRKLKPKDPEEKKRIDEEKAILKEFIRAKSIPKI